MENTKAISLRDVWLKYRVEFKEDGKVVPEEFWAIKEIDLDIGRGESICIIGENGAGKTTLLKIIAGMLKSDKGTVKVNGTVSTLMEIGAGFHKDLTGRENTYLISSLFGLSKEQIEARYNDIVKFAAIGRFINAPVKCYSQGMYMRLAFAIAIHVDPDILLIDDIFLVGDLYAQRKCINKMFELKEKGKTIVFVTHNLEMAKRFCQRGVLLKDGRVIKDGMLKEVISYYLQTVGDKKGIGVLQGAHLGLVFNNGKLILNYDNDNLTKEWAGHSSILSSGNWYPSLQADWELKESSKDRVVLEGKWWDLPIWQSWEIKLDDIENIIDLRIKMDIQDKRDLQEVKACFMFRDDYKYWFNPFNKEPFEVDDLSQQLSWQCVDSRTPVVNFIGLCSKDEFKVLLPSVIIEDEVYIPGKLLEVQNTNRIFQARVLQSTISQHDIKILNVECGKHLFFHIKIKVIKDSIEQSHHLQIAPKTMLPKVINDGSNLSLAAEESSIILYWNNKKITSSKGFKTDFYYNQKIYHSSDAIWMIHRASETNLDIIIHWPDLPIKQIWNFGFLGNNLLSWKIYVEILKEGVIRNNEFKVMFSPEYNTWITSSEEGDIVEEVNTQDFKNIMLRNDLYGIIGLKPFLTDNSGLPSVLLHNVSGSVKFNSVEKKIDRNTVLVDSLNNSEWVTELFFLDVNSKDLMNFTKGLYLICDTRILISEELEQKKYIENIRLDKISIPYYLSRKKSLCTLEEMIGVGEYRFSFNKGRGRIFFKDREITKNLGLYTSIYSRELNQNGQWYASLDAIWEILRLERKRLLVKGIWPYLPVAQIWEIRAERNKFTWKIDMEIFTPTFIERQQANLMLSGDYNYWKVSSGEWGSFPEEFALLRWDSIYRERGVDRLYIGNRDKKGRNDTLHTLVFSCLQEIGDFEAIVENSNNTFGSRNLGFDRVIDKNNQNLQPGLYKYFYGTVAFLTKEFRV